MDYEGIGLSKCQTVTTVMRHYNIKSIKNTIFINKLDKLIEYLARWRFNESKSTECESRESGLEGMWGACML